MSAVIVAMLFVQTMFGFCDGKKFNVRSSVSVEGKNSVVTCGAIYTTEGLGYRARGGDVIFIPVDGDNCYTCGPCTYPAGMSCTRASGECLSPSRPTERLEQRLAPGRSIVSIDESSSADEVYTGILDAKQRPSDYKVEPVAPIANLDPRFFQQGSGYVSGDGSGDREDAFETYSSGDIKSLVDLGVLSGDESRGVKGVQKPRDG